MEEEKAKYGELSVEINQLTKSCRTIEKEYDVRERERERMAGCLCMS